MNRTGKARRYGVAVLAAVTLALGACGTGPSNGSTQSVEIDPNAILKFSSAAPIRNLDPALQTSYGGLGYLVLAYDRLTMLDKNDNVIPGLATKWDFAKDGSYLELKLRNDVKFHDGTPFNAAAVKANIERGKTMKESTIKANLADITSVTVVDDYTVRLNLVKGGGVALPSLFVTNVGMMVSPKALADSSIDLSKNPGNSGSGPYIVTSFTPNQKVIMKRAPSYWDPNAGRLAGIELEPVADTTTRLKGVQTGITDLTTVSSANDLVQAQQLADQGVLKMNKLKYRNVLGVYLRANKGDLSKPQVRQAIADSIDPAAINALFSGTCTPQRQLYPEGSWPAIQNYQYPYPYDLEKAKSLIKSVGGAKVTITFPPGTNADQPANVIQSEMAAAGIDATLSPVPNSENEPRFIAGDFELMVANSFSPPIDPAQGVSTYLLNTYKLATEPSLSEIKTMAAKAGDPNLSQADRAPLYAQIWQTVLQEVWYIPICQLTNGVISNAKVVSADNIPWANIGIWDLRYVAKTR
jgi:peptide/nickel transport system substrate-binding protein